jgi:hypothetical protein
MRPDLRIQQAVLLSDNRTIRVLARTPELDVPEAERIAVLYGPRPAGVACPLAHFACPFGAAHVAVVRVEDRPGGFLGFRFLILAQELYRYLGDPFAIADRYPPNWLASGPLRELTWPEELLPERTLEQLDAVLKAGDTGLLLAATQVLVDGNRVLLRRGEPDEAFARGVWLLLPERTRRNLWPASFAFSEELGFHLALGPTLPTPTNDPIQPLTEEAIRDYPSSPYELNLQIAIETGDREALRRLLARRTSDEAIRLGLYILAFSLIVAVVFRFVL